MTPRLFLTATAAGAALLAGASLIPATEAQEDAATVGTATHESYGTYLTDGDGRAVYLFEKDQKGAGESTCLDACAEAWPPVTTSADPEASGEAQADMLGTIERQGGETQVTYNGWPLYYFVRDQAAGDVSGQDVEGFGAEWYLLTPEGEEVHAE